MLLQSKRNFIGLLIVNFTLVLVINSSAKNINYDDMLRITHIKYQNGCEEEYIYDKLGNRLQAI